MGKPTLVLDMDQTLICTLTFVCKELQSSCDMTMCDYGAYIWKRPGVHDFLRTMSLHYNVVVYTNGVTSYARFVMDNLDPAHQFVVRIMDRRHQVCSPYDRSCKDLTKVRKNLKRVVWLDDLPEAYPAHQHDNGIVVPAFIEPKDDTVLPQLTPFLVALSKLSDFRQAIAAYKAGTYEVIDERIIIDGKALEPPDRYEDDDVGEPDLKELEEQERLREEEELARKRREDQEAKAQEKAEEDRKKAEMDTSLWKCCIDKIDAVKMSACDKERAIEYIRKKFKNEEADKLVIRLVFEGGEDMLVKELKGAGVQIKSENMYYILKELFFGLKGPTHDYNTRQQILDILVKVTVEFFYYGKPVEVVSTEMLLVGAIMDTQIPQLKDTYHTTLVFFEPICMNATCNFLRDNRLLPPGFEAPEPFTLGSCALEGWWQYLIPVEFDKFWQLHRGKVADMIRLSDNCPMPNGLYGLASEILPGKRLVGTCGGTSNYEGATIPGDKLTSIKEFFASAPEDSMCKFLVCLDNSTVLFRSKFEDGTVAKCVIWIKNVSSCDIGELPGSEEEIFFCFAIGGPYHRFPSLTILLKAEDVFSDLHLSMLNSAKVDRVQFPSSVVEEGRINCS